MKEIEICFDIDGTLRCNCTDTCQNWNYDTVQLAELLWKMKNTKLFAWSGGGREYAQRFVDKYPLLQKIFKNNCRGKLDHDPNEWQPHIAIDDIHECELGKINLIVRNK